MGRDGEGKEAHMMRLGSRGERMGLEDKLKGGVGKRCMEQREGGSETASESGREGGWVGEVGGWDGLGGWERGCGWVGERE